MAGKSQPMSTFAIRFNPASVVDDDDDEELYGLATTRPKKEIQFERRSASPSGDIVVSSAESVASGSEPTPMSLPGTLWKAPLQAARSAPVSEVTSPVTPLKTNASSSETDRSSGGSMIFSREDSQRSIFSELRDKLVNQSRDILPKKLNKTGSADASKIVTATQDFDKDKGKMEETAAMKSRPRPGSDAGEALAKEILKAGSTEFLNGEWYHPCENDVPLKRSSSFGQLSTKPNNEFSGRDSDVMPSSRDAGQSASTLSTDTILMSDLVSSAVNEVAESSAPADSAKEPRSRKPSQDVQKSRSPSQLTCRLQRAKSFLRIPGFLKKQSVVSLAVILLSIVFLPLSPFFSGFATGSVLTAAVAFVVYRCFLASTGEKTVPVPRDLKLLPPLQVPEMKESRNIDGLFKGWMNELSEYDVNNFHINLTHSVFATLEGSTMRLQTPKQGIPKRAMCDENLSTSVGFVRQRHYDIRGCNVFLLPADLVGKRLWSKKYPICLEIYKRPPGSEQPESVVQEAPKHSSFSRFEFESTERTDRDLKSSTTSAGKDAAIRSSKAVQVKVLYLFARSSREKEEWFRRFVAAAAEMPWPTRMSDLLPKTSASGKSHARTGSTSSIDQQKRDGWTELQCPSPASTDSLSSLEFDYGKLSPEMNLTDYLNFMARIMPAAITVIGQQVETTGPKVPLQPEICDPELLWLNTFILRCFLDFFREKYWTNKIRDKIQKKLCKMHVPNFIDQLTVTDIELGSQVPIIRRASKPYLDDRGLWVDLDVCYGGGFCITLETKCNLMKLKSAPSVVPEETQTDLKRSGTYHSDEEDSAESTTDEEAVEENSVDDANLDRRSEPMSKKVLRFVEKISKSRYFQQATDYRYIKKAMEEVSNTRLVLNVEVKAVSGTLAINIPPPPTDRIWYGLRGIPNLTLSAKPRVGERVVSLSHITEWIEKKLAIEFQRVFVMPNMDDIPIALMCDHLPSAPLTETTTTTTATTETV